MTLQPPFEDWQAQFTASSQRLCTADSTTKTTDICVVLRVFNSFYRSFINLEKYSVHYNTMFYSSLPTPQLCGSQCKKNSQKNKNKFFCKYILWLWQWYKYICIYVYNLYILFLWQWYINFYVLKTYRKPGITLEQKYDFFDDFSFFSFVQQYPGYNCTVVEENKVEKR